MSSESQPDLKPPEQLLEDPVEQLVPPQVITTVKSEEVESFANPPPKMATANPVPGHQSGDVSPSSSTSRRSTTPEPSRKKRKVDPTQQMQTLYDFMRRYRREDGSELCDTFIRAPKRRTDPAYYEVVSDPIDMLRIQQKLKMDEYTDMEELKSDFAKLFNNALAYYKKGSLEHRDASEMSDLFQKASAKVELGEDPATALGTREESEEGDINDQLEDLFAAVMTTTDPTDIGRPLNIVFRLLPSPKRYPEYYQVITEPIDLKTIATKIVEGEYTSINQCEDDLNLMCKNAMTFNEPGSQIYRDAKSISRTVKSKKSELEVSSRVARENRGVRATRRVQPQKKHYAAEIANIPLEESESDDESSDEEDEMETDDPMWVLYNAVRYHKSAGGNELAEPFITLPSKRELPDYYLTIPEPISLSMIRKKLKNGEYSDFRAVYEDLNLMFENCKTYNRQDSRLYKDGCRLQRVLKLKLDEIEAGSDVEDEGEEEEDEDDESEDVDSEDENDKKIPNVGIKGRKPQNPEKKAMRELYNFLMRYRSANGVQIIGMFMDKPSKKDYPDYYEVIERPMDMRTINDKIKSNAYKSIGDCLADFKLMFANCMQYNEENSDIYVDAKTLEKALSMKVKTLIMNTDMNRSMQLSAALPQPVLVSAKKTKKEKTLVEKMRGLYETLRDYKDPKGRQLSLIFLRLPNIKEFPDYYEVIKRPIDFEKIGAKLKHGMYPTLEMCFEDFGLMFDNACKFNEPDSQIYKDALTLHGLAKQTFRQLMRDEDDETSVPDVNASVQEILSHIFTSMYNHQDAEERCYSDSLAELPEYLDQTELGQTGSRVRALNLDIIKRRLDKGLYKRLDLFQRDIFSVLERARRLSRTDSQVFEDSTELQSFFIKTRDEACEHGEILQSRALLYTQSDLMRGVEELRAAKQLLEQPEEEGAADGSGVRTEGAGSTVSATFNMQQYNVGDFVYVDPKGGRMVSQIFHIESMFTTKEGVQTMYANQFFRPVETFHVPSRKFLEQEVFCSDVHQSIPLHQITGRCCVVSVKDYFRLRPEGFENKDIFVCESRYNSKSRSFKKMKIFWAVPSHIKMVFRTSTLEPKRVQSVFKDRIERHKEEIEELEELEKVVEEELPPNVVWENNEVQNLAPETANNTYFEQYTIPGPITLRRGDAVYVRAENGKNLIAQIDTMWTAADGMAYFHGPWFVTPREIQQTHQQSGQLFYRQEAMISTIQDTNPLLSVVGLCCVLEMDDYIKSRPTQYEELNVYVCENVYDESRRVVRPLPQTGLKGYDYQSTTVVADEVFYFKNPIHPQKEQPIPPVPMIQKAPISLPMEIDNEDSLDAPPSIGSIDTPTGTPYQRKKLQGKGGSMAKAKSVTPYIVFASEIRKSIVETNKSLSFGEISRLVGDKWRQMTDGDKIIFEEKARKINEENQVKHAEEAKVMEERRRQEALMVRNSGPQTPNASAYNGNASGLVHSNPLSPQGMTTPRGHHSSGSRPTPHPSGMGQKMEPIFHTVPPRPQRLLHSEAYIRYIEGLTSDSATMCNWDKQLKATKENTKHTDEAKLPAHWLADTGDHATSLDALWALRDFLTCDSLGLAKLN